MKDYNSLAYVGGIAAAGALSLGLADDMESAVLVEQPAHVAVADASAQSEVPVAMIGDEPFFIPA